MLTFWEDKKTNKKKEEIQGTDQTGETKIRRRQEKEKEKE